jgi:riboflavin transporter FmnP
MKMDVNKMVKMGVLSALSLVLMFVVRFPIIPSAPFLEYEPADVPILIGGFIYGPAAGLVITIVVSAIQALTVSAGSGWIGAVMHVIATGAFVVVAGLIYKRFHTLKGAIAALILGSLTMTLVMIPLNLLITPKFLGTPVEVVKAMLIPAIIPFNLLKSSINSIVVAIVYKSVGRVLRADEKSASLEKAGTF